MSSFSIRLIPDALRSRDAATFDGTYQTLGNPLTIAPSIVKFINNSNELVLISWDGVTDNDVCPAGSAFVYDVTTNRARESGLYIPVGTQFYVNGVAGVGLVYLVVLYAGP